MGYDYIKICLEQKNIFMTNIVNFTKQLEVKSQQEEIDFEDILSKRKENMDRIDKCNVMIQDKLKDFPLEKQQLITDIINGITPAEQCQDEFVVLAELAANYRSMLNQALSLDKSATISATNRYHDLKGKLSELRNPGSQQNLYHL